MIATYQGKPCSKGHDGLRYRSTRACVECVRLQSQTRGPRFRMRGRDGATGLEIEGLLAKQGGHCAYCPSADRLHLDHKTPRSRGGSDAIDNLQWLCATHNLKKGALTDDEFRALFGLQRETPDAARAPSPMAGAAVSTMAGGLLEGATLEGLDARALGVTLAAMLEAHGRAHLALTRLDSGLWQAVALRPGYRDQVTRCARDPGEAVRLALTGARGRADELLDVVG